MEKFILKSKQIVINEEQLNVILSPDHYYLFDKIEASEVISSKVDIQVQIDELILILKPLMFATIQEDENIPQFIKDNIEL